MDDVLDICPHKKREVYVYFSERNTKSKISVDLKKKKSNLA